MSLNESIVEDIARKPIRRPEGTESPIPDDARAVVADFLTAQNERRLNP
jgi:hypothetical protein